MTDRPEDSKEEKDKLNGLVLVIPFNSSSDLLILTLEEYAKLKRRGDLSRGNRRKKEGRHG